MRQGEADGGTDRRKNAEMIEGKGRASGELEGSTLGSSSRDGERSSRGGQRKIQGPNSFLLDSSFGSRSKTPKAGQHQHHHPRHPESERREKRAPPDADNPDSRKKSRFTWRRQRKSVEASSPEAGDTGSRPSRDDPQLSNTERLEELDKTEVPQSNRPSIGLDQDSIQIVNLALDLNESRRKGNLGRSGSHRVSGGARMPGQSSANYVDSHVGETAGPRGRNQGSRNAAHSFDEDRPREQLTTHEPLSVSNLLPNQTDDASLPQNISENTLARVAKARRHFELFGEYLRLLPSLPPLRPQGSDSADGSSGACRVYNPLQTIRNRKVRYREKCPINVEPKGWNDVGAVHEWVSNTAHQYSEHSYGPFVCLRLPQLRQWHPQAFQDEGDEEDLYATTSAPDSAKYTQGPSSLKARRQRFDWTVSPAELLADAAWIEDGFNKGRMVNKDGENLYPDAAELIPSDANFDASSGRQPSSSAKRVSLDVPSRPSFAEPYRVSSDYQRASRGRSRHRLQSPSSLVHSSSASTNDRRVGRRHSKGRARSSSSISIDAGISERSALSSPLSTKMGEDGRSRPAQEGLGSSLHRPRKSPRWTSLDEKRASLSSGSADDLRNRGTGLNSPIYPGFFPSMAVNLSPPSSRSPSPSKRHFSRKIVSRHEISKTKHRAVEVPEKGGKKSLNSDPSRKPISPDYADLDSATGASGQVEFDPPSHQAPPHQNEQAMDETPAPRRSGQYDSKLRGIFKGKGKLAEKVGNEVSKVGDFIMKKDHQAHSRQSSFATSATSEEADVEPGNYSKASASKSLLRRLPTLSDDSPRQSRKELNKTAASKDQMPSEQPLAFPAKQDNDEESGAFNPESSHESSSAPQPQDVKQLQRKTTDDTTSSQPGKFDAKISGANLNESFDIGPSLPRFQAQSKKRYIKDPSIPYSMTRPPVTGLAQAEATPPPSANDKRPTLSGSWTISDRSIPTLADLGIFKKREVERTRALLLSSGIKAREITRRAETVRDPPDFLQNSTEPNSSAPRVIRLREFDMASQNLDRSFKKSQSQFQQAIDRFPSQTASPLKSQLNELENLINNSLAPRVRSMGSDAETLTVKLNTTSTLALKQLSDTLDKGVRKRRRRLRWVRRAGFVMLEWALVGMLWWVWLIVMAFKLLRSVFRGAISGVRWVLWL